MKKKVLICAVFLLVLLSLAVLIVHLSARTVPGSEETVQGVVIDCAAYDWARSKQYASCPHRDCSLHRKRWTDEVSEQLKSPAKNV